MFFLTVFSYNKRKLRFLYSKILVLFFQGRAQNIFHIKLQHTFILIIVYKTFLLSNNKLLPFFLEYFKIIFQIHTQQDNEK